MTCDRTRPRAAIVITASLLAANLLLACGGSTQRGVPTPSRSSTPAPPPTDIICQEGLSDLVLAGAGEIFLAGFTYILEEPRTGVQALRFSSDGRPLDPEPLIVRGAEGPYLPSFAVNSVTTNNHGFQIQFSGDIDAGVGVLQAQLAHRTVPLTGAITEPMIVDAALVGIGQCQEILTGNDGISADLTGENVHVAVGKAAGCAGQGILIEWIEGIPGAPSLSNPEGWVEGKPALARSDDAVAGMYFVTKLYPGDPLNTPRVLAVGWIEGAPPGAASATLLTGIEDKTSRSPAIAALEDTFLAVWASEPASGGLAATEIRLMRFDVASGALDPEGGVVVAGNGGTIRQPTVTADGENFVVLWAENTGNVDVLRTIRVARDGTLLDATPIDLATIDTNASFDIAATTAASIIGYTIDDSAGQTCVRVQQL